MNHPSRFRRICRGLVVALGVLALSACATPLSQGGNPTPSLLPTRTPAPRQPTVEPSPMPRESDAATSTPRTRYVACSAGTPWRTSQPPTLSSSAGRIAYLTREGNLALTDPTGRQRAEITRDAFIAPSSNAARIYQFPAFSPDGTWLAFVAVEINGFSDVVSQTVYAAPAQDRPPLNALYQTADFNIPYLDWSPDGQNVAFLTINPLRGAIRLAERDGSNVRVVQEGTPTYWHWRADSRAMLTHIGGARTTNPSAVLAITATRSGSASMTLAAAPGSFQSPHYAPDGAHMLYVISGDGAPDELVLADGDGKPLCTIAPLRSGGFFAWSPDGGRVAFMDTQAPISEPAPLFVYDLERGQQQHIHTAATMFFWSPSGERIAVYSIERAGVPDRFAVSRASPRRAAPAAQAAQPVLRIEVFDLRSDKLYRVADIIPSRQFAQYFQFFDQYSRAVTPWSPDGSQLVFTSIQPESQTNDVVVASFNKSADRYESRRIASGILAFWSPR